MKKISITLISLFIALSAWSDVTVSVTGTATNSGGMGYDAGESYTFNWTINDGYNGSTNDQFKTYCNWWQSRKTSPVLWSDVSGDGLSGTYSRPTGSFANPLEQFEGSSDGGGSLTLVLAANSNMGLTVNGVNLQYLSIDRLTATGLNPDYSDTSFVNPATWATNYIGTYDSEVSTGYFHIIDKENNITKFTANSLEIVPEPASVAMLGLISGLGLFIRHWFLA